MKTIELHLPDDLADKVYHITENAETFIIGLVRSKINELDQPLSLADQYRLEAAENTDLLADFTVVDLEGWDEEY